MKCRECEQETHDYLINICYRCKLKEDTQRSIPLCIRRDIQTLDIHAKQEDLTTLLRRDGTGFFFHGLVGTGKSVYAAALLIDSAQQKPTGVRLFVSTPEFLRQIKATFDNDKIIEEEIVNRYAQARILVLDDIGVERCTDWAYNTLYHIVNYRYENMLPTIYTSNAPPEQLADKFNDDRIPSRIAGTCIVRSFGDKDRRVRSEK